MTREEMIEIKEREGFESVEDMITISCPHSYGYTFSEKCYLYGYLNGWDIRQCEKCWKDAVNEE